VGYRRAALGITECAQRGIGVISPIGPTRVTDVRPCVPLRMPEKGNLGENASLWAPKGDVRGKGQLWAYEWISSRRIHGNRHGRPLRKANVRQPSSGQSLATSSWPLACSASDSDGGPDFQGPGQLSFRGG
jgi:hypothetical protein